MKLSELDKEQTGIITLMSDTILSRMLDLGVLVGDHLKVEQNLFSGEYFLVSTPDIRIGLTKQEADGVIVELVNLK